MRFALLWALCLIASPGIANVSEPRIFEFTYNLLEQDFPTDRAVDIYLPLPPASPGQQILVQSLQSSVSATTGREPVNGNAYYHLHRPARSDTPITASLRWTVARVVVGADNSSVLSAEQREQALAPDTLVPVGHEILKPILAEIHAKRVDDSPESTARAIYDWVVDNVEYKKVGTGWGNGDTFWACTERYGNCTDFHALFISLARSEGIPARFEMGFPVPLDSNRGDISGYHCWVHFYLPERGWVPIDASEAAKHPEKRELFYGAHPADRVLFSTGRDLVLSPASAEQPLNYFIYPYVEVGGKRWAEKVAIAVAFEEKVFPAKNS